MFWRVRILGVDSLGSLAFSVLTGLFQWRLLLLLFLLKLKEGRVGCVEVVVLGASFGCNCVVFWGVAGGLAFSYNKNSFVIKDSPVW